MGKEERKREESWESGGSGKEQGEQEEEKRAWQTQEEAKAKEEEKARAREEVLKRAEEAVNRAEAMMREARMEELEQRRTRALARAREEGKKRAEAARQDNELVQVKDSWQETFQEEETKSRESMENTEIEDFDEFEDFDDKEGMDSVRWTDANEEMSDNKPINAEGKTQDKSEKGNGGKIAGLAIAALFTAGVSAYCVLAQEYKREFFPNTIINGVEAGKKNIAQVEEMISSAMDGYKIRLIGRDGQEDVLTKEAVGLHTVFDGSLEEILKKQNPYLWGIHLFKKEDLQINTVAAYDETAFQAEVDKLSFLDPQLVRSGKSAYLSDYIEGTGYEIIPEDPGNELKKDVLLETLGQAMLTMQPEFSLEENGCYLKPLPGEPDADLVEQRDMLNRFAKMTVTYTFGEEQEVLDGDKIHKWVTFDESNQPVVDEELVKEYVAELAKKYDTANTVRKFTTSYGSEVEVSGTYGWKIDQKAETEALKQIIAEGESMVREPEYSQEGVSRAEKDYGDTYAEVNLTAQHLFLYKDGEKVLESDFVSGNVARGYTTPPGIFSIAYKQRNAVLRGPGYASPVNFWMPFNGGIGFHDASWRGSFGGSIYRTNGSHGCVNMPYNAAKTMFETVYAGMPVICYNLDGTSNTKSTSASGGSAPKIAARPTAPAVPAAAAPVVQPQVPATMPAAESEADGLMGGGSVASATQGNVPETEAPSLPETQAASLPETAPAAPAVPGGVPAVIGENSGGGSTNMGTQPPAAETPAQQAPVAPAVPAEGAGTVTPPAITPEVPGIPGM